MIAKAMVRRAIAEKIPFRWVTADAAPLRYNGCLCRRIRFIINGEADYPHLRFPDD